MDYIELLTKCLAEMFNSSDKNLNTTAWMNKFGLTNTDEAREILKKFSKDGYVIEESSSNSWQISIDGRLFVQYGGYHQRMADQDLDRDYKARGIQEARNNATRQLKIQISQVRAMAILNRLTKAVAVATVIAALYYLLEIIKFFASACHARCISIFY
jgi:hypothetical protein